MQQGSSVSTNGMPVNYKRGLIHSGVWRAKERVDTGVAHLRNLTHGLTDPGKILGGVRPATIGKLLEASGQSRAIPIALTDLLNPSPSKDGVYITLGVDEHGRHIQLNLLNNQVGNVLISGMKGAGKSALLRTIGASVALENRQSTVQLGAVGLNRTELSRRNELETLRSIGHLPHCIFPVIRTVRGGLDVIDFLADELNYRRVHGIANPLMVVIIDGLEMLLASADRVFYRKFGLLLNQGPDNGYRLFISIEDPIAKDLRNILKYDFPLRLVGRAVDADRAWAAAGIPGSGAELLRGSGDFIVVRGGNCRRFQTAYIGDDELRLLSRQLETQKGQILLAHPAVKNGSCPVNNGPHRTSGVTDANDEIRVANGRRDEEPEWLDNSGSDDWLTGDWLDRFWMDRD